ncbi:Polyprotein [Phytophthora palmivora]|uniref:Polyprotein n=1 Tax=Phytophthora palmivora TaxID=4796 RepID=A0A2P4YCS0_9STRA|nr:Polyprotein [Phytophthora palmivora]
MEAEYIALSECIKEVLWMRRLLKDLGAEQEELTVIYEDNQGAMALAKNVVYQSRIKHIDIRYHFVCEKVNRDEVELVFEQSKNQLADVFIKSLSSKALCYFMVRSNVGPKLETSNGVGSLSTLLNFYCWARGLPVLGTGLLGPVVK